MDTLAVRPSPPPTPAVRVCCVCFACVCVQDGRVVESGKHAELLSLGERSHNHTCFLFFLCMKVHKPFCIFFFVLIFSHATAVNVCPSFLVDRVVVPVAEVPGVQLKRHPDHHRRQLLLLLLLLLFVRREPCFCAP